MSGRRCRSLIVGLLALCASANAQQSTKVEETQKQALIALEQHWLKVADDPAAVAPILADDFIHVLPSGLETKAEQLKFMRANPPRDLPASRHLEDVRVRIFGNIGIVNGVAVATAADRRAQKTIFTDVFAYRNGRWQAINSQEMSMED